MTTFTLVAIGVVAVLVGAVVVRIFPMIAYLFHVSRQSARYLPGNTANGSRRYSGLERRLRGLLLGEAALHLDQCSRWPERRTVGRSVCNKSRPILKNAWFDIVSKWYEGQVCVYCHRPFGPLHHLDHVPASDGTGRQVDRVEPPPTTAPSRNLLVAQASLLELPYRRNLPARAS